MLINQCQKYAIMVTRTIQLASIFTFKLTKNYKIDYYVIIVYIR